MDNATKDVFHRAVTRNVASLRSADDPLTGTRIMGWTTRREMRVRLRTILAGMVVVLCLGVAAATMPRISAVLDLFTSIKL